MYNFNFLKNEELIDIFENVMITQEKNERYIDIALTNKRLLFLDYDRFDPRENLRVGQGVDYVRYKEVFYYIDLKRIKTIISNDEECTIIFNDDNKAINFDDEKLYKLLKKEINR